MKEWKFQVCILEHFVQNSTVQVVFQFLFSRILSCSDVVAVVVSILFLCSLFVVVRVHDLFLSFFLLLLLPSFRRFHRVVVV